MNATGGTATGDHAAAETPLRAGLSAYVRAEKWQRRIAVARSAALLEVAALQSCGATLGEARAAVAARRGIKVAALKRWGRIVHGAPRTEWVARLLPVTTGGPQP